MHMPVITKCNLSIDVLNASSGGHAVIVDRVAKILANEFGANVSWVVSADADLVRVVTPKDLGLTPRQGEILGHVLQGMSNKKIAQVLDLAECTVKEHVSGILLRLSLSKRAQVSHYLHTRSMRLELSL
jgi:DNA-binding NarL/FixJ family response regulator